jgi:predicted kinase
VYFALAERYATETAPPRIVMMVGLSGSGKSHLANALAGRIGAALVSSDAARKRMRGLEAGASLAAPYGSAAYAEEERERVYRMMLDRAREHVVRKRSVVLDATYIRCGDRNAVASLASALGVPLLGIVVDTPEEAVRRHLRSRGQEGGAASDADWAIYVEQRKRFEPPDEIDASRCVIVDGSRPVEENIARIMASLSPPA